MKYGFLVILSFIIALQFVQAQKPKLVVGVVVDQMRNDYIDRFWNKFGKDGFKSLVEEGFWCKNTHYNYFPTYTGPGHASIYTGTTPARHGIVANDWFDRKSGKEIYCTEDPNVKTVGADNKAGKMSPTNLLTTTITDQLKLSTNYQSKVIGISLKDRGAILPAGFYANAAYWFDPKSGNFISSTFYMDTLPTWVSDFNEKKKADEYLDQTWHTLYPITDYTESIADNNPYETVLKGKQIPTFPYPLARMRKNYKNFDLLKYTPFGNTIVADMALEALQKEDLGKDSITDFMCVSFSSTDYIGHEFGPRSVELEDTYLRLDQELERLLKYLDDSIGYDNYVLFLTSDHGVAENSIYLADHRHNAGVFDSDTLLKTINKHIKLNDTLSTDTFVYYGNQQFYYAQPQQNHEKALLVLKDYLQNKPGVLNIWSSSELLKQDQVDMASYRNGYQTLRSGDVFLHLAAGWTDYKTTGATHGSIFNYDTHVPLLWSGPTFSKGESNRYMEIRDIAKTLAYILRINEPEGCNGTVIQELFELR